MSIKRICYRFNIRAAIIKRNGKTDNNYRFSQLGYCYEDAVSGAYFELKSKKVKLLKIHSASVASVAFAYDEVPEFVSLSLEDYPITIPTDLNRVLENYRNNGF